MVNKVSTATVIGLNAYKVDVEIDTTNALPSISIVGLPDVAVNEARDRVRSATRNSGLTFPSGRVIVNLAPADLKKEGSNFDLPIAVGIQVEEEVIPQDAVQDYGFIGELSLDGTIRPVNGVLPLVLGLRNCGLKNVIVPKGNAKEAALVDGINVFGAEFLSDVVAHFTDIPLQRVQVDVNQYLLSDFSGDYIYDFKDVKGQQKAKKALEIAAAGGHNMLMFGSPGSGKTLMAKCFPSILPPLELSEALELTKIYSICGLLSQDEPLVKSRPFRLVHHTASPVGIIGGGTNPKPGEITLAHRGVLFLDEMVEFPRNVLEVLRQPLEDGEVAISRAKTSIRYPAKFILLGAMNPCPCGYFGDKKKQCTCSEFQRQRYLAKLSGPLLDRIDLQIEVPRLSSDELLSHNIQEESSDQIRKRVVKARQIQLKRYKNEGILTNSELTPNLVKKYCQIEKSAQEMLRIAIVKYQLSGRRYDRTLKLARTIADLEGIEIITQTHLMQALQYRMFNQGNE